MSTTTTAKKTTAKTPPPPAAAVAADPHWAAKMAKLRARRLAENTLRLWDDPEDRADFLALANTATRARRSALADPGNALLAAEHQEAKKALAAAEQEWAGRCITLTFRALPGDAYEAMVKAHPPTEEQAEDGNDWNDKTFCPALVSASCTDPMTPEEAAELLDTWGPEDRLAVFQAALAVQNQQRSDLGKG